MRFTLVSLAALAMGCQSETGLTRPLQPVVDGIPGELETPFRIDRITQVTIPKTDVLFVVDNSCSMEEEQVLLGTNFPTFLDWFQGSGLDYHIGVVSTDMNDPLHTGRLRSVNGQRWVQDTTDTPEAILGGMAIMGTDGHYLEQGRAAAYTAVEVLGDSENLGFIREDAGLHIAVVSDEDDESGGSPVSRQEFVDYMLGARPTRRMVSFSSIVGPAFGCENALEPGSDYLAITHAVGGVEWSICTERWDGVLDQLGFTAVGLQREFFLTDIPVVNTLSVATEYEGVTIVYEPETEWVYDDRRNSITFLEHMPEPGEVVVVEYRLLSSLQDDIVADLPDLGG